MTLNHKTVQQDKASKLQSQIEIPQYTFIIFVKKILSKKSLLHLKHVLLLDLLKEVIKH